MSGCGLSPSHGVTHPPYLLLILIGCRSCLFLGLMMSLPLFPPLLSCLPSMPHPPHPPVPKDAPASPRWEWVPANVPLQSLLCLMPGPFFASQPAAPLHQPSTRALGQSLRVLGFQRGGVAAPLPPAALGQQVKVPQPCKGGARPRSPAPHHASAVARLPAGSTWLPWQRLLGNRRRATRRS